jgi:hypothetical protein
VKTDADRGAVVLALDPTQLISPVALSMPDGCQVHGFVGADQPTPVRGVVTERPSDTFGLLKALETARDGIDPASKKCDAYDKRMADLGRDRLALLRAPSARAIRRSSHLDVLRLADMLWLMHRYGSLALSLLLAGAACECGLEAGVDGGPGGEAPAIPGAVSLSLSPPSAVLVTDGTSRPTQAFTVLALIDNGEVKDVSSEVALSLSSPGAGDLEGATFRAGTFGSSTQLVAQAGALEASASITVRLEVTLLDDEADLPPSPGELFEGAPQDPARAPSLVYPNDGVLVPPNLGLLEVHFYPGEGNELFEIAYESPIARVVVYTRCTPLGGGCVYTPSAAAWRYVAQTHQGSDEPLAIVVRGTDDEGLGQGASGRVAVRVSAVDVSGALYYWSTTERAILRVDFGGLEQVPERFFPVEGGGTCYGCHALSPDGTRMSLSQNGQNDGRLTLLDVGTRGVLLAGSAGEREQFQAWDPSSSMFAAIYGDGSPPSTHIRIRDGNTGDVLEEIDVGLEPSHPHWSPAGDRIAYTAVTRHQTSQRPGRGGISYIEQEGATWSEPRELLAPTDGLNRYTPVYSPDGSYLVYVESVCPGGEIYSRECDADADDTAKLWAMGIDGQSPVRLERAGGQGALDSSDDLANTFPRWAPFEDARLASGEGRVHWMTFSSRRRYGLRDPGNNQLLWMVAVDPDRVADGEDGSYPAFALPFQDLSTSNHMAQWTEAFVSVEPLPPGDAGPQCVSGGEACVFGVDECCPGFACVASEGQPGACLPVGG